MHSGDFVPSCAEGALCTQSGRQGTAEFCCRVTIRCCPKHRRADCCSPLAPRCGESLCGASLGSDQVFRSAFLEVIPLWTTLEDRSWSNWGSGRRPQAQIERWEKHMRTVSRGIRATRFTRHQTRAQSIPTRSDLLEKGSDGPPQPWISPAFAGTRV